MTTTTAERRSRPSREDRKAARDERLARREARKEVEKVVPQSDGGRIAAALESIAARLPGGDDSKVADLLDALEDIRPMLDSLGRRLDDVEAEQRAARERKDNADKDPAKRFVRASDVEQMIETAFVAHSKKTK